ncbi:MAG: sigma-54 interaction domain-containing protein [Pyrinomonadaceae bacterium]
MFRDEIDIVAGIAVVAGDPRGVRTDTTAILEILRTGMSANFGFVCLKHPQTGSVDVVAAVGLDAAAFRRLENRAEKSVLVRVLERGTPLFFSLESESTLAFLDDGPAHLVVSVPIVFAGECIASISLAFGEKKSTSDRDIVKLLEIAAAVISLMLRTDRLEREDGLRLIAENSQLKHELREKYDFRHIIGNSGAMVSVRDQIGQISRSNATLLLRGESGTGKELIAATVHYNSLRSKRPFAKVNCASLPESLTDAELFGSEPHGDKGSGKRKKGRIEIAEGGTVFLDEVSALPLESQENVLRVLDTREFETPGGETINTNIRLIAATSKDLEAAVDEVRFSKDLYHRLNIFTIFLPPLRERKSDILLLAEHFLEKYGTEHNKQILRISTPAIDMLTAYHYPGNVRELENAIERAVLICDSSVIHGHHLPPTLQTAEISGTETRVTLASAVDSFECDMIQDALKSTRGNVAKAAIMLDSTERILGYKIKKYGVDPRRFKQ